MPGTPLLRLFMDDSSPGSSTRSTQCSTQTASKQHTCSALEFSTSSGLKTFAAIHLSSYASMWQTNNCSSTLTSMYLLGNRSDTLIQEMWLICHVIVMWYWQEEYEREGINASTISYSDNRPLLDMLISVSNNYWTCLHRHWCNSCTHNCNNHLFRDRWASCLCWMKKASFHGHLTSPWLVISDCQHTVTGCVFQFRYAAKFHEHFKLTPHYKMPKDRGPTFSIVHYAGQVRWLLSAGNIATLVPM